MPRKQPTHRTALYRLDAYGLRNPMTVWAILHGHLDDTCPRCQGRGFWADRMCAYRENSERCSRRNPCDSCRHVCADCRGKGVLAEPVRREDFGDVDDLAFAQHLFPRAHIGLGGEFYEQRSNREARAL